MDNDKVNLVLSETAKRIAALGYVAKRNPPEEPLPHQVTPQWKLVALEHALWMCEQTLAMPADKLEKKMRWLGFVQGILWMAGVQTVETSKRDNMPDVERAKAPLVTDEVLQAGAAWATRTADDRSDP